MSKVAELEKYELVKGYTPPSRAVAPSKISISNLPDEVILCIFQFLSQPSLLMVKAVCRLWHNIAMDNLLWKELIPKVFGSVRGLLIQQSDNVSFHDLVVRKKQSQASVRRWSRKDFKVYNLADITGMGIDFHPSNMKFYANFIYFCKSSDWMFRAYTILRVIDRRTATFEDIPLDLKNREVRDWGKKFSIQAITSEYLIFQVCLESNSFVNSILYRKFCFYDRKAKTYLWESENNEVCPDVQIFLKSTCIFSRTISQEEQTLTVRARDLQTGNILFMQECRPDSFHMTCASSDLLNSTALEKENLSDASLSIKWTCPNEGSVYQIHGHYCIEQEGFLAAGGYKNDRAWLRCTIYDTRTEKKIAEINGVIQVLGLENNIMIIERSSISDTGPFRHVDVYKLGDQTTCINRRLSGNMAFENFYQDGMLIWKSSSWRHIYWSYIDFRNDRKELSPEDGKRLPPLVFSALSSLLLCAESTTNQTRELHW